MTAKVSILPRGVEPRALRALAPGWLSLRKGSGQGLGPRCGGDIGVAIPPPQKAAGCSSHGSFQKLLITQAASGGKKRMRCVLTVKKAA